MLVLAFVSLVSAGPSRCVATWTGPSEGCGIRGEVKAAAAGPSEKAAARAAEKHLAKVAELTAAAQRARSPGRTEQEFAGCAAAVKADAYVNCFADASLADEALCFVELVDPECWNGQVLTVDGVGWEMVAEGRRQMCEAVDARLVQQNYTDLATRRAVCAAACASKTTVRCP